MAQFIRETRPKNHTAPSKGRTTTFARAPHNNNIKELQNYKIDFKCVMLMEIFLSHASSFSYVRERMQYVREQRLFLLFLCPLLFGWI
jgi:hypothetical protein